LEFRIARLHRLRSSQIGGLLMVVSHWNAESATFGEPVLRVVASPALATLGSFSSSDRPGINLQEAWDLDAPPFDKMPVSDYSCPLLAMAGGFSRGIAPLTIDKYLSGTSPLFIPSGEDVAGTVSLGPNRFLRAIFLPTFAHLPIGMSWKLEDLTVDLILKSVKALTPSSSSTSPCSSLWVILVFDVS
jgi:hypothetical protein